MFPLFGKLIHTIPLEYHVLVIVSFQRQQRARALINTAAVVAGERTDPQQHSMHACTTQAQLRDEMLTLFPTIAALPNVRRL